jgi:hypothetical protein
LGVVGENDGPAIIPLRKEFEDYRNLPNRKGAVNLKKDMLDFLLQLGLKDSRNNQNIDCQVYSSKELIEEIDLVRFELTDEDKCISLIEGFLPEKNFKNLGQVTTA